LWRIEVDRKSNIEQLEAAKDTNKHFIKQLKEENKHLRKELAEIRNVIIGTGFGTPSTILGNTMSSSSLVGTFTPTLLPPTTTTTTSSSSNTSISSTINATTTTTTPPPFVPNTDASEELKQLIILLTKARKAYDDTKHKVSSQVQLLEELKDEVKDLELESKKPSMEDTPETRKIRLLENRLDKAMIKYNEAQSIRKTYEQIVKRLKEERIGFDTQLAAMERALVAKQHDFDELLLLSTDAVHAKEMTLQELEKQRGQFEEEKKKEIKK
jgi:hypothetical protein